MPESVTEGDAEDDVQDARCDDVLWPERATADVADLLDEGNDLDMDAFLHDVLPKSEFLKDGQAELVLPTKLGVVAMFDNSCNEF